MNIVKISEKDVERFWKRVRKDGPIPAHRPELGPCWIWTGGKISAGYGTLCIDGVPHYAHRLSWEIHFGPIPDGLWVLHHCDRPQCCSPLHLHTGTHTDNMRDCAAKGRYHFQAHPELVPRGDAHYSRTNPEKLARGDRHGSKTHPECLKRGDENGARKYPERLKRGEDVYGAKLNPQKVLEIRRLHSEGVHVNDIALKFGVRPSNIVFIVQRKTWKHVTAAASATPSQPMAQSSS